MREVPFSEDSNVHCGVTEVGLVTVSVSICSWFYVP